VSPGLAGLVNYPCVFVLVGANVMKAIYLFRDRITGKGVVGDQPVPLQRLTREGRGRGPGQRRESGGRSWFPSHVYGRIRGAYT